MFDITVVRLAPARFIFHATGILTLHEGLPILAHIARGALYIMICLSFAV